MTAAHPVLGPLERFVGTWTGEGTGQLPDDTEFRWTERMDVAHAGTPALSFRQRTRRPDGSPFHAEDGWVRVPPELQTNQLDDAAPRQVELVVAGPTGVLEALAGRADVGPDGLVLDSSSTTVTGTPSAGAVQETRRRWTLEGDRLVVEFWMATPRFPTPFHHLTAWLTRA